MAGPLLASGDLLGSAREGSVAFRIRTARQDDLTAIERVLAASYPVLMAGAYEPALLARALPMMTKAQPRLVGSGTYYVAEAEGEIVGCGGWSPEAPDRPGSAPGVSPISGISRSAPTGSAAASGARFTGAARNARAAPASGSSNAIRASTASPSIGRSALPGWPSSRSR
jgi:hypothetical protein